MDRSTKDRLANRAKIDEILETVVEELVVAQSNFPTFHSGHEGYAVMKEKLDRLWDEAVHNEIRLAKAEAVQVAAMAIRFVVDL